MPTARTAFRLDPDLVRRIDLRAKAEGMNRTAFVVGAIEAALANVRRAPMAPGGNPLPEPTRTAAPVGPDCPHPKANRVSLGYATKCNDCGKVWK